MPEPAIRTSFAFPSDGTKLNGLSVKGAEAYSGAPATADHLGRHHPRHRGRPARGSPNGNSTGDMLVRFRSTGSAVLLAWGGHLAQSDYWDVAGGGGPDGAALVSGAPWHMRTLQLDGAGNKNQDRSIQPSAIVGTLPPQALAPTPRPTPGTDATGARGRPRDPRPSAAAGSTPGRRLRDRDAAGSGRPVGTPWARVTPPATSTCRGPCARARTTVVVLVLGGLALLAARRGAPGAGRHDPGRRRRPERASPLNLPPLRRARPLG